MCYTEIPVEVVEGKGAEFSYRLESKTTVAVVLDNPCMCPRRQHDDSRFGMFLRW